MNDRYPTGFGMPKIVTDLTEYREEAQLYYQTPEFFDKLGVLYELILSVREKLSSLSVAVDVEGTLVSRNMALSDDMALHQLDRIRRPLANELLVFLERYCGKTFLWTGALLKYINPMIKSAGLQIPSGVDLVSRNNYEASLRLEHADLLCRPDVGRDARLAALLGHPKFPYVMNADILFDDRACEDRAILMKIGEEEANKVVDVESFSLDTEEQLARHHLDTGLIDAVRTLVERI